ncbi:hypothetical protein L1887_16772 [Cichorium endivia]|nr:hypothetical protein L1887_16772 [Cichorium endivia]
MGLVRIQSRVLQPHLLLSPFLTDQHSIHRLQQHHRLNFNKRKFVRPNFATVRAISTSSSSAMVKAIRVHELGGPEVLKWEDVEIGEPKDGEIRVRNKAIGVNFIDIYFRQGVYKAASMAFTPGMEAVGVVTAGSLACLKTRGHLVSFGQSSGAPDPIPLSALAVKSLYLTRPSLMQYTAKRDELLEAAGEVFGNIANGVLRVRVNHKYPLSQAGQAHSDLESRKTTGSIVLIPDGIEL